MKQKTTSGFAQPAQDDIERTSPDDCDGLNKCDDCGSFYVRGHSCSQSNERRPTVGRVTLEKRITLIQAAESGDPDETVLFSTNRRSSAFHRPVRDENGHRVAACGTALQHNTSRWVTDTRGNQESVLRRFPCTNPECYDIDVDEALP